MQRLKMLFSLFGKCPHCNTLGEINIFTMYLDLEDLPTLDFECPKCHNVYYFVVKAK